MSSVSFADVSLPIIVEEEDGTPSVVPYKIKVTDTTLTDNADGTVSLDISGTGDADQNLWATFNGDSGTTTANSTTDTLTVSGGGTVTTGISGDTLTITGAAGSATAGGSDTHIQFNDATAISGDPGFSFNKTTDSIYVAGNAHIVGGIAHVVGSMGATLSVDTPAIENSFGGPVTFRDKANAYGYDVGTTVITVTDFTDEGIQAAIDALPVIGGTVQLLPGSYKVDDGGTVTLPSRIVLNISIIGSGKSTILNHTATDGSDCISITGPGTGFGSRAEGLTLSDFKIVGNASSGDGLSLFNIHYGTIKNIWVYDSGAYGVKASRAGTTIFENIIAEECTSGGFYFTTIHQNRIIGCEASENDGPGITIATAYETLVSGCALEYNTPSQLYIQGTASAATLAPGYISGNQMSSGNNADGIKILDSYRWGISNNVISYNDGDGLEITDSHQLLITGNTLNANINSIVLANSSENIIANNKILKNTTSDAITQDSDCRKNIIYSNEVFNDNIFALGNPVTIDKAETAWTGKTNVTTTRTSSFSHFMEGVYGSKNVIDGTFGSGLIATYDFSAVDLSGETKAGFWIKATEDVAANVLELCLDNNSACASPLETLSIPALTEDDWKYVELSLSDPSALTAIISVGLNADSDPGAVTVYIDDITTEYPKVWYDTSAATLEIENSNLDVSDRLVSAHIVANIGFETGVNIKLEPKHLRFNIWDPNAMYDDDETVCIWPQTDAAITVSKIELTLDADPTTELNTDLMFADVFIAHPSATVIDNLLTTSGTTSISSGFDDPTVPASKAIFIRYDGDPDSGITQASYDLTYSYD